MANAKRRRRQDQADDDFVLPLVDALPQLLPTRHITAGATWYFQVQGDQLVITRTVAVVSTPDPDS